MLQPFSSVSYPNSQYIMNGHPVQFTSGVAEVPTGGKKENEENYKFTYKCKFDQKNIFVAV